MRGSFFGLNVAVRGLHTSQRALYIAGHNISNVNTPGYSRQVGNQQASQAIGVFDGTGMIGTGSEITGVSRVRDVFLDHKYWGENVSYGEWETKHTAMDHLEAIFSLDEDSGSGKVMEGFYSSLQELSKDPSSLQTRETVRAAGEAFCKYFNSAAEQLQKARNDNNRAFKIKVDGINSYAEQIRSLNEQIYRAELDGSNANDLRDQRTVLVDELSKIVNIEAGEVVRGQLPGGREDRQFEITLNGSYLVNHDDVYELECYENADKMYDVRWKDSGNDLVPKGGELKAYKYIRDVDAVGGAYKGIPYYMEKLDEFVRYFAQAFNEGIFKDGTKHYSGHAGGVGLDGSENIKFFSYNHKASGDLTDYSHISASNITLSSDIEYDVRKIAAASVSGNPENKDNITQLLEMRHDARMFAEGAPEDFMQSLVANLGVDAQQAKSFAEQQESIVQQIENRRLSVSGVLEDEEMLNIVRHQHAYNAAAKMISVIDEIYDVMINRMGV